MKITSFLSATLLTALIKAKAMVGTNIGGWLVLEPWITPSFFYRFLGKTHSEGVGLDSWTVCEALGPTQGNALMRAHWDAWMTEDHMKQLSDRGVEIVRLPIGDWTINQYGPYVGCMDGVTDKIQWFLDTAAKYNIKVLIDFHALKDSQNGFDNSGKASDLEWVNETHYKHWSVQNAHWQGNFNGQSYDSINWDNINWAIDQVRAFMLKWGQHPALYALEPINEPWGKSDVPALKSYFRSVRSAMREINHDVIFVFYPSDDLHNWNDLFEDDDIENTVLDTHFYTAWNGFKPEISQYCDDYTNYFNSIQDLKYDIWVGEWSLATDPCAFWLAGFNEGGWQPFECQRVECPFSYLPEPYNVDFDRTAWTLGPWGETDNSMVKKGTCLTDSSYFSNEEVQQLADCSRDVFDKHVKAQFIWTFRNELEPKWDFIKAYDQGWLNKNRSEKFLQ